MSLELFQRLGLALAIGFLVGVERGWHARDDAEGARTAGIRTFALIGLLGGISGLLAQALGGWAFAAIGAPFAAAFILFKHREQVAEDDYSVTAIVAALLVYALGAYAIVGDWRVAAAASVVATGLLAFKGLLHGWLKSLTWPELRGALVLLAMSFVALPLLPNRGFGPHGAVNPYELWLLTIAMAGIAFVAYAAIKIFGASRGAILSSLVGALISSTAVTLNLSRLNRERPEAFRTHLAGALLAGGVMAVRLCAIAAVLAAPLFQRLLPPLAAFAVVSTLLGGFAMFRAPGDDAKTQPVSLKSPFDLALVFKFALVLGAVMAAARILSALFGSQGLLIVAALSGLVDADAVTLTASRMVHQGLNPLTGAYAVLLAAGVDSVSKSVIAGAVGGWRFGLWFAAGTLIAAAAALATMLAPIDWWGWALEA